MARLTADLVERLGSEQSPEARIETATAVTREFCEAELTETGRAIAEEIFRLLLTDAEVGVRVAMSEGLRSNMNVPSDIAVSLAEDVAEVAIPILEASEVFSDEELIKLVKEQAEAWQFAIAGRHRVSESVSDSLVEYGNERVVDTLVRNYGADISDDTSYKVIDKYANSQQVMTGMASRPSIPPKIAERLIGAVSESIRRTLKDETNLPPQVTDQLVLFGREAATLSLANSDPDHQSLLQLIEHLDLNDRLTSSLILRALYTGDLPFFQAAMAKRAGVPASNVRTLMEDRGDLGIASLCDAAGLPKAMAGLVETAANVIHTTMAGDAEDKAEAYRHNLVERFRAEFPDLEAGSAESLLIQLASRLK